MERNERKERDINLYLALLLFIGVVSIFWALYGLRIENISFGLAGLSVITVVFGSFLRIQLPRTKIHLTGSDPLIFLSMLLYGGEVAVLLGTLESAFTSLSFKRNGGVIRTRTVIINALTATASVFVSAAAVTFLFGRPETVLNEASVSRLVVILFVMAAAQFAINSALVSIFVSIKTEDSLWRVWNEYCLNALVMYLSSALMAGVMTKALQQVDTFLFFAVAGFFALVYFMYTRYVNDIRSTAEKAEQAERARAEQAETHVSELEHYIAELERSSLALRESREKFRHAAYHDALTGLANRTKLIEILGERVEEFTTRPDKGFSLLFLDLNRFKTVNDSLGHSIGDRLIVEVSRRLTDMIGENGAVARFSGDEFAIFLSDAFMPDEVNPFADRITKELARPFDLDGRQIFTSVSVGIVYANPRYKAADEMLRDADIAMYYAKENNKSYVVFDQIMHARAVSLLELETDLRFAIERKEFELYYQPFVNLDDLSITGFEALIRWNHPSRGLVTPGEFISVAESTGLIIPMTVGVLRSACEQIVTWRKSGIMGERSVVSVNLSAVHLAQYGVVDQLRSIIFESGVDPENLKLEITESAVMQNAEQTISVLRKIKDLGVRLSIDDFGTGYSSLSYLHRFPIDTLKIDRSFVSSMEDGSENGEIVRTVIALAKALKLSVIAEGIESIHQFHQLRILGCEYGQGYLFTRPVPVAQIAKLMADENPWKNILPINEFGVVARNLEYTQLRIQ